MDLAMSRHMLARKLVDEGTRGHVILSSGEHVYADVWTLNGADVLVGTTNVGERQTEQHVMVDEIAVVFIGIKG